MEAIWESLNKILSSIDKSVETRDLKVMATALRYMPSFRRELGVSSLPELTGKASANSVESESFVTLLQVSIYIQHKQHAEAQALVDKQLSDTRANIGEPIIAKFFFYLALLQEQSGNFDVKPFFKWLRVVSLRHDTYSQATLVNIILRFFLLNNEIQQAAEFASKTGFPESAPYSEIARNQYYLSRVCAFQLNYAEAHDRLVQASRKAPENLAAGFKLAVDKLRVLVELLMGAIPTRKALVGMKGLQAYAELVRAVRSGELDKYTEVVNRHKGAFSADQNLSLVERLRHIVIKSGLKRINYAYSSISLQDIASKLGLPREDTEFIVAKAIRDKVIQAVIDHEEGVLRSDVLEDKYKTLEPQQHFSKRVAFCLDLRNDAVKAMRFPAEAKKQDAPPAPTDDLEINIEEEDDLI